MEARGAVFSTAGATVARVLVHAHVGDRFEGVRAVPLEVALAMNPRRVSFLVGVGVGAVLATWALVLATWPDNGARMLWRPRDPIWRRRFLGVVAKP